jgi:hypothetical protein
VPASGCALADRARPACLRRASNKRPSGSIQPAGDCRIGDSDLSESVYLRLLSHLVRAVATMVAALSMLVGAASAAVPAWTTYRHDAARSGIDPESTSPLPPVQAWQSKTLDASIYA